MKLGMLPRRRDDEPREVVGATAAPKPSWRDKMPQPVKPGAPVPKAPLLLRRTVLFGGLSLLLLAGPISCMAQRGAASEGSVQQVSGSAADQAALVQVQSTAVAFVRQWQVTTSSTVSSLYAQMLTAPVSVTFPQQAAAGSSLVEPAAVRAGAGAGQWIVTVHAAGGAAGAGEWYDVPVQLATQAGSVQTAVTALPALVPAPTQMASQGQDSSLTMIAATDPAVQTGVGFLGAWLGSSSSVTRWTVPGYSAPAMATPVCRSVQLQSATANTVDAQQLTTQEAGGAVSPSTPDPTATPTASATSSGSGQVQLHLTVSCVTGQTSRVATYSLGLTQNSGQWAVQSLS